MTQKKHILGVTGGVGCGKSTVLGVLRDRWGAEIIEADALAKELMMPGGSAYRAVVQAFGTDILVPDTGEIDRGKLAAIVFADEAKRQLLNALTHPLVKEEAERRIEASAAPVVVYESAIPREAMLRELCDEVWYVHTSDEVRIARLMATRGYSREKCLAIMASQMSEAEFTDYADRVIENDGTPEETEVLVDSILAERR